MREKKPISAAAIRKVYRRDCLTLAVFSAGLWAVLISVLRTALTLCEEGIVRGILTVVSCAAGVALTCALLAVFLHLKKNRTAIYTEDLTGEGREQE